jgi:hypothetical protein
MAEITFQHDVFVEVKGTRCHFGLFDFRAVINDSEPVVDELFLELNDGAVSLSLAHTAVLPVWGFPIAKSAEQLLKGKFDPTFKDQALQARLELAWLADRPKRGAHPERLLRTELV